MPGKVIKLFLSTSPQTLSPRLKSDTGVQRLNFDYFLSTSPQTLSPRLKSDTDVQRLNFDYRWVRSLDSVCLSMAAWVGSILACDWPGTFPLRVSSALGGERAHRGPFTRCDSLATVWASKRRHGTHCWVSPPRGLEVRKVPAGTTQGASALALAGIQAPQFP